jgi:hypothetical protein
VARLIDVQLDFADGRRWFIENKIDPGYQDHLQILDQARLLTERGHLILIAPSALEDLLPEMAGVIDADPRIRYVPWREIGRICQALADRSQRGPLVEVLLRGVGGYQGRQEADPFIRLIKVLIEERSWVSIYADDCEAAFRQRFPQGLGALGGRATQGGNWQPASLLHHEAQRVGAAETGFPP